DDVAGLGVAPAGGGGDGVEVHDPVTDLGDAADFEPPFHHDLDDVIDPNPAGPHRRPPRATAGFDRICLRTWGSSIHRCLGSSSSCRHRVLIGLPFVGWGGR